MNGKGVAERKISDLVKELRELGAALLTETALDGDGNPLCAIIVVDGPEETAEILAAVKEVEDGWDE